jgi:hypothetical protein
LVFTATHPALKMPNRTMGYASELGICTATRSPAFRPSVPRRYAANSSDIRSTCAYVSVPVIPLGMHCVKAGFSACFAADWRSISGMWRNTESGIWGRVPGAYCEVQGKLCIGSAPVGGVAFVWYD